MTKNVAHNVINEMTTYGLLKTLAVIYEKFSTSNNVYLIRQLVNMRIKEGASVASHINELNSLLSRLVLVDIKFDDKLQALFFLSSMPDSWDGTVTTVSSSSGSAKLPFKRIKDFILGKDNHMKNSEESQVLC